MTLRTATRLGMIGMSMPLVIIAAQVVFATIDGIPTRMLTVGWDPIRIAQGSLPQLVLLVFLLVLNRAAAGQISPARVSDAAMWSSILLLAALALNLSWSAFFVDATGRISSSGTQMLSWAVNSVLEPFIWLAFLVTFVRVPAPPLQGTTRRAALALAVIVLIGGVLRTIPLVVEYVVKMGVPEVSDLGWFLRWNFRIVGALSLLRYVLVMIFGLAVWRMRPKPQASEVSTPTSMS